jgi:hypothetical protein
MVKWLRWLREETRPTAEDANRIVAKSSEQGKRPCYLDPIEELVRTVGSAPASRASLSEKLGLPCVATTAGEDPS